jgi:hypothetical protein
MSASSSAGAVALFAYISTEVVPISGAIGMSQYQRKKNVKKRAFGDLEKPKNGCSVLSRFRFLGERLKFLEDPPAEILFAMYLFMRSTVYFQVGATHPAHPVDKSLDIRERSSNNYMNYCIL